MRSGSFALLLAVVGCGRFGFDDAVGTPSHVSNGVTPGASSLVLADATIDTTALTIDGAAQPDFTIHPQANGPDVAVLAVASLTVTGTVRVVGDAPLIVFASGAIQVDGLIDGGARGGVPGAGGYADGPGRGGALGKQTADVCDPGGGGGGFGGRGGDGGGESCTGAFGAGGEHYGDATLLVLEGGSGGGVGSPGVCNAAAPGAGGGAIQLTSLAEVNVIGGITVGGGGGGGGPYCNDNDGGAGDGGGAGGAIFVEAPSTRVAGMLRADGGGGGAGGNGNSGNGTIGDGAAGGDGTMAGPGSGGATDVTTAGSGGDGGGDGADGAAGVAAAYNPGGGGGAAGRIVVRRI